MKPTFHLTSGATARRAPGVGLVAAGVILAALGAPLGAASAQVVSGRIDAAELEADDHRGARRGYVETKVTAPAEAPEARVPPLAVFLRVKESLPLEPSPPVEIALAGLGLAPAVAACSVDGEVVLRNADVEPATFRVGDARIGPVAPGASATYECTAGKGGGELRTIHVEEWPSVVGTLYVGELGAAGAVDAEGRFRVGVAKGTYILRVIGRRGVLEEVPVEVPNEGGVVELDPITLGEGEAAP